MKLAKINPKHLFRSKKERSVSRSDTEHSVGSREEDFIKSSGRTTPTSVLPPNEIVSSNEMSDEWSDISSEVQFDLIQAFRFLDTDNDGRITTIELEMILNKIGGCDGDQLSSMLKEIDLNGDGFVTLEEFGAISSAFGPAAGDDELREVFEFFDMDRDGKITADELLEVFTSLGDGNCTLDECIKMIKSVDVNGDGFVCFEDFRRMMDVQQR